LDDFDGWDKDDVEREDAGEIAATRDGTVWTGVSTLAEG
jgi:hypothetical protein